MFEFSKSFPFIWVFHRPQFSWALSRPLDRLLFKESPTALKADPISLSVPRSSFDTPSLRILAAFWRVSLFLACLSLLSVRRRLRLRLLLRFSDIPIFNFRCCRFAAKCGIICGFIKCGIKRLKACIYN